MRRGIAGIVFALAVAAIAFVSPALVHGTTTAFAATTSSSSGTLSSDVIVRPVW